MFEFVPILQEIKQVNHDNETNIKLPMAMKSNKIFKIMTGLPFQID